MNILLIEPFYAGSHKQWCDGFQQFSEHDVEVLSLPGRYWKWRMHGAAVTLAQEFLKRKDIPDLIVASDMLDISTFVALTKEKLGETKIAVYFHENQLTYPWSKDDADVKLRRDEHYAFINYTSALTADRCFFNSQYHKSSFLDALPSFLEKFPDHQNLETIQQITNKSEVLYLGMDLKKFDLCRQETTNVIPIILWNHRWEYDKNPDVFFQTLFRLKEEEVPFHLVVLGESYTKFPAIFNEAKERLKAQILHFGYADSFAEYAQWLWKADVLPVTSNQDFFGGSVVEAMYCNTIPILPNRLAYPEHLEDNQGSLLYTTESELYERLKDLLQNWKSPDQTESDFEGRAFVNRYDWSRCINDYDAAFEETGNF